jgi:polyisoprenyl-teichoic acid--peptidoglycan teichoic acid transferase
VQTDTAELKLIGAAAARDVTSDEAPAVRRRVSWRRVLLRSLVVTSYCTYIAIGAWLGGMYVVGPVLAQTQANAIAAASARSTTTTQFSFPSIFPQMDSVSDLPSIVLPDWKGKERINVLLMGVDQRDDEKVAGIPTRSDTMIVLSIDPVQKSATMISFPRDLWVMIPGFGEERINVAYRTGELRKVDGGGAGLAARTLELNFGLKTNYFATVDFHGFEDVVNTVGGIVVDVPRPIKDDTYPTDDFGVERIYFPVGPQLMNGATALKYARTRHADSDFGRMARQQQVLFAIRDRALRLNMLPRLPTMVDQGLRTVQTNLSTTELLSLGKLAADIDTAAVGTLQIDNQLVRPVIGWGGAALLMPKKDEIKRAIERAMADPRLMKEAAKIETATAGAPLQLLADTGDRLAGEGLQVVRTGAPTTGQATTQLIVYTEKPRTLQVLLRSLGLTERAVVRAAAGESDADIRVVLGREFVLPPLSEIRG